MRALRAILCALALSHASTGCTAEPGVTFTAAGDYGFSDAAAATLDAIGRARPAFHLALGDFSYSTDRSPADWCAFVRQRAGTTLPFLLVTGNHEDDFGEHGHIRDFTACLPDRVGVTGRYGAEYYFDYQDLARVIMISPDLTVDGAHYYYGQGNDRLQWLARTIDAGRAKGLPWVVVGMHKSCVSVGVYDCRLYADLWNLLVDKRVDLTLHGHEHGYQRTRQLALGPGCVAVPLNAVLRDCVADDGTSGAYVKGQGLVSVVVGTAGADFYETRADDPERGYVAAWMDPRVAATHGFLRVRMTETELAADFVATRGAGFSDKFVIAGGDTSSLR